MTTRRKRRARRERRMAKAEPKQHPRPRMILWKCKKCETDWMTVLDSFNFDKRPDAVATTICDKCIERMAGHGSDPH